MSSIAILTPSPGMGFINTTRSVIAYCLGPVMNSCIWPKLSEYDISNGGTDPHLYVIVARVSVPNEETGSFPFAQAVNKISRSVNNVFTLTPF